MENSSDDNANDKPTIAPSAGIKRRNSPKTTQDLGNEIVQSIPSVPMSTQAMPMMQGSNLASRTPSQLQLSQNQSDYQKLEGQLQQSQTMQQVRISASDAGLTTTHYYWTCVSSLINPPPSPGLPSHLDSHLPQRQCQSYP